MNTDADLLERLSRSGLYREFQRAFGTSTGLPLRLHPREFRHPAHRGQPHEQPFCALITQTDQGCAAYLQTELRAVKAAQEGPATVRCLAGLCHTAVPVKLGERTFGFLLTGQVALEVPSPVRFEAVARQLSDWGLSLEQQQRLQAAYYQGRVLSADQYAGIVALVARFAGRLGSMANQIALRQAQAEPSLMQRAKADILLAVRLIRATWGRWPRRRT